MNTSETTEALVTALTDMAEVMESLGDLRKARVLRASAERMKQLQCDVPTWISVDERLPDNCDDVLAVVYGGDENITFHGAVENAVYDEVEKDWILLAFFEMKNIRVTHWMPLPEPPSETRGM